MPIPQEWRADLFRAVGELCFRMEKAQSLVQVREVLQLTAQTFGARFFLFGVRTGRAISPPVPLVITSYPSRWRQRYDELGALSFDPVLRQALLFRGPFRWDRLHQSPHEMALRRESVLNGMKFGFSTSDRGPDASIAILSFAGDIPIAPEPAQWDRTAHCAAVIAATTHKVVLRIVKERRARNEAPSDLLNENERKCLALMAADMTAEEAADALGVRVRTIRYYLDRAAVKLGVTTRKQAVMKALVDGIIDIRPAPSSGFGRDTEMHG